MAHNYVPDPRVTVAGQWPKSGQASVYVKKNGDRYPCQISMAYPPRDADDVECGVQLTWLEPIKGFEDRPWMRHEWGWKYRKATGECFYDPCGPPWAADADDPPGSTSDTDDA